MRWRTSEKPTGRYRSFQRRAWPSLFDGEEIKAQIRCKDDYIPAHIKDAKHSELEVWIAVPDNGSFQWRRLIKRAKTLKEAKELGENYVRNNQYVSPIVNSAIIRGDYRYTLTRSWDPALPTATFIMLNPSTADAEKDDPTIRRCISFAKREHCGSLHVVNLFALRSTDPWELKKHLRPVGPENAKYLKRAILLADGPVIAAWGTKGGHQATWLLELYAKHLYHLGLTKDGHPKHPLYLASNSKLSKMVIDT